MLRNYASIVTAIWRDASFRALDASPQRTFILLFSQAEISAVGVLTLAVTRWARYAKDTTVDLIEHDLKTLADARYVLVERDTDELFVRSFARWDRGYNNPKRVRSIIDAYRCIMSPLVRSAAKQELERLKVVVPPIAPQANTLFDSDTDGDPDSDADREADPYAIGTGTSTVPIPIPIPEPELLRSSSREAPKRVRGSRLPEPFPVTDAMRKWAAENAPHCGVRDHDEFCDYWRSQPGVRGVKVDWVATWRNWMRKANDQAPTRNGTRLSTTDARVAQGLAIADRLEREEQREVER